jgi:hypothetical protein
MFSARILTDMRVQRNLPARGFRPSLVLLGVAGIMTYGFWKVGKGIREQKYEHHRIKN